MELEKAEHEPFEDDEEDENEDQDDQVELGFAVKIEEPVTAKLLHDCGDWSRWDGGLIGGRPRWLNPMSIPSAKQMECEACAMPLTFLVQIYCPLDEIPDAFHRSLYVFCCRNPDCPQQGR